VVARSWSHAFGVEGQEPHTLGPSRCPQFWPGTTTRRCVYHPGASTRFVAE
jgi:hypothetical protein